MPCSGKCREREGRDEFVSCSGKCRGREGRDVFVEGGRKGRVCAMLRQV